MTHGNIIGSRRRTFKAISATIFGIMFTYVVMSHGGFATAGSLTAISDTMSTLETSAAANHDIKFRSPTGQSSGTIAIDFDTAGFTSGTADYTDIDLQFGSSASEVNGSCTSNCTKATLAGTNGAATWGAAFSTNTLTLTYPSSGGTAITANDYVRIIIGTTATTGETGDQQLTNAGTTGSKTISITAGSDTGKLAVVLLADNTQLVGTTIDPYLTFAMDQSSVSLTKSGGGNPTYSQTGYNNGTANTLQASTNAASGYTMSYFGDTLKSNGNAIDAMSVKAASTTNSEQFGFNLKDNATPDTGADASGGSGAADSDYDTADQYKFVANATTTMATAAGSTETTTYTASYIANITQTTEAGNYSTVITYVCTGNF